jgi:hypothetical protein
MTWTLKLREDAEGGAELRRRIDKLTDRQAECLVIFCRQLERTGPEDDTKVALTTQGHEVHLSGIHGCKWDLGTLVGRNTRKITVIGLYPQDGAGQFARIQTVREDAETALQQSRFGTSA